MARAPKKIELPPANAASLEFAEGRIYVLLDEPEAPGKKEAVVLQRLVSLDKGTLCHLDPKSGTPGRYYLATPELRKRLAGGGALRGLFTAEKSFAAEAAAGEVGGDLVAIEAKDAGGRLALVLPKRAAAEQKDLDSEFMALADADLAKRFRETNGAAEDDYNAALAKIRALFASEKPMLEVQSAAGSNEGAVSSVSVQTGAGMVSDLLQPGWYPRSSWSVKGAYFQAGAMDLLASLGGKGGDGSNQKDRKQLWKLKAVPPADDATLGYAAAQHGAIAAKIKGVFDEMAPLARKKGDVVAFLRRDIREESFPYPLAAKLAAAGVPAGARNDLFLGVGRSLNAAIAQAIDAASKVYETRLVTMSKDEMTTAGAARESLVASTAFTFATGSSKRGFFCDEIGERVKAWWRARPDFVRERLQRLGGRAVVDGYASAAGKAAENMDLSQERRTAVADALEAALREDGQRSVALMGDAKGAVTNEETRRLVEGFNAFEIYASKRDFERVSKGAKDNPWNHRAATVQVYENPQPAAKGGTQKLTSVIFTRSRMPIVEATLCAAEVGELGDPNDTIEYTMAVVLVTPGKKG